MIVKLSLDCWFHVNFDADYVYREVNHPISENWQDQFQWKDIIRICFKPGVEIFSSDELYIFTDKRPESYVIPLETDGGSQLWNEIIERELFSAELAIKVATSTDGIYCWPEADK